VFRNHPLPVEPAFAFGSGADLRDPSKPVGYDAQGRPFYAPR
jgi:hypothetical protein